MLNQLKTYLKFGFTIKQLVNRFNYIFCKKGEILKYRPLWLLIYVSDLCNLRCKMCPHHTQGDASKFEFLKKEKGMLKPESFKIILEKFPQSTLVMFAGVGEPLINPYFLELAGMAVKYKKIINLVTNGTLLDRAKINRIIELRRFNQVSISLNAFNPRDYYNICNMPSEIFWKVINNVKELVRLKKQNKTKAKFEIIVSAVCSQQFLPKVKEFLLFADNLMVDRIDVHNYIDFSILEKNGQWSPIVIDKQNEDYLQELKYFAEKNIRAKVNLPILLKKENFYKKCEWFFKNLCFDAYGNIGACGRVINPNHEYGNIFNNSEDIWNNLYMRSMRRKFLEPQAELENPCYHCIENFS